MNLTHFTQKLLDQQRALLDEIAALTNDANSSGSVEAGDFADSAETDEETSTTMDQATRLTRTLEEVRDALQRINEGTYGNCIVCGKQIDLERLEAIPWTLYCRKDAEAREERMPITHGSSL